MHYSRGGLPVNELIERHLQLASDQRNVLEPGPCSRVFPFPNGGRSHADSTRELGLPDPSVNARRANIEAQC